MQLDDTDRRILRYWLAEPGLDRAALADRAGVTAATLWRRLDRMRMVGVIQQPKINFGLIKADASVYRVKIGNYMGQNFGIITNIGDNQIVLRELVQDAGGDWTERQSTLQLVESGGGGR